MHVILGWLVQNTLVVALLVPVVLLLGRLWRFRPANQHLLWLLLLIKLLTPPLVNWPLPGGWLRSDEAGPVAVAEPVMAVTIAAPIDDVPFDPMVPAFGSPSDVVPVETSAADVVAALPARAAIDHWQLLPFAFAGAWLIGSAAVSLWLARQLLRQVAILRHAKSPTQSLQQWVSAAASLQNLRGVRVRISEDIASPFISCLGRPTLVWPAAMAGGELERFQAVLAHELAHLARRDHWTMWLELVAMQFLWFNPLVWYLRRRLEETRELACDALALESAEIDRGGFAELLLSLSSPDRLSLSSTAPLAAGIGSAFHRRLAMLFCDRASGRISLAGLLVAGLFAAAALPGWAQTADDPKPKATTPAPLTAKPDSGATGAIEPKTTTDSPAATRPDSDDWSKPLRVGTIGEVTEIKEDLLHIELAEGKSLPGSSTLLVIRITPTHSEMIGGLRIMEIKGREVVAKLEPRVGKPQVGDQLWPATRTTQPAMTYPTHGGTSALTPADPRLETTPTPPGRTPAPVPVTPPAFGTGGRTTIDLLPANIPNATTPGYPAPAYAPSATPAANYVPGTTQQRPTLWASVNEGGSIFQLEDGSKIIASLGEDGALHMFLEKEGKRQELSKAKETSRTGRSPGPRLPGASTGNSSLSPAPHPAPGAYPTPAPMPAPQPMLTQQAVSPRQSQLLAADLELAKLEVEEKQILLSQAAEKAKKGEISDLDVRLKEVELRKAQIRLKQVQLQFDEAKPSASPAGR